MTESDDRSTARPDLSALRMERDEAASRPRRRIWPWLLFVSMLVGSLAWALLARPPLPWLRPVVETAKVELVSASESSTVLTATGYTYARTRAAVGAKIIGRVEELRVDEGDRIERGEVIAVLDSADLQAAVRRAEAAVLEAEARLVDAERELARQERIVGAGVGPQADLDAARTLRDVAEAQLETARATLESTRAQLAYTVITSPIGGVVIERNVEVGEMVAPGGFTTQQSTGSIVRIADPASLEVEADINESYIARLSLGQPASIRVDAVPDHDYRGRLRQIVPTADRQRAVVGVKVTIEDRDERLVPDMSCSVTFLEEGGADRLTAEPRLLIPAAAIRSAEGADYALRVVGGRLERSDVELGNRDGERVEILSGLSAGDEVVVEGPDDLDPGQPVRLGGRR